MKFCNECKNMCVCAEIVLRKLVLVSSEIFEAKQKDTRAWEAVRKNMISWECLGRAAWEKEMPLC